MPLIQRTKRAVQRVFGRRPKFREALRLIRRHAQGAIPRTLFHYTSADALLKILASGELWAGNIAHLNDSRELAHGVDVVEEVITKQLSIVSEPAARDLLKGTKRKVEEMTTQWAQHFYAVSFCSEGDLLSQWRGYGRMGGGYCVGFDPRKFPRPEGDDAAELQRISYLKPDQRRVIASALKKGLEYIPRGRTHRKDGVRDLATELAMELFQYLSSFKDRSFSEEKEWRLVTLLGDSNAVQFRAAENALKPYIVVPLRSDLARVPIQSVRHGPALDREVATKSLTLMLSRSHPRVRVLASNVPFRVR